MIRRDCLSKCRRDRAYCYCKSDAIHMFSDVIHVSTLLDIRPFLTIFGFSKPKFFFWGGVHKCGTPSLAKSFSPVLCWQTRRERVLPRRSDAWQSGSRRGTRFAFVRRFCLRFCSYHCSAIGAALPPQRFRKEIALQNQQIFGDGFVVGHMRDAGQRQERVLASGRHQRLAQA